MGGVELLELAPCHTRLFPAPPLPKDAAYVYVLGRTLITGRIRTLALRKDLERGFVLPVRGRDNRKFRKDMREEPSRLSLAELLDVRPRGVTVVWMFPAPPRPDDL
jgi:hypothetical protein